MVAEALATSEGTERQPRRRLSLLLFGVIAALMAGDVLLDAFEGARAGHLVVEGAVLVLAFAGLADLVRQNVTARKELRALTSRLRVEREDAAKWRAEARELLQGLSDAIDRQFSQWELSKAEREVALLLLKGLSLKDIAAARSTSERTVRQQAFTVYRKAGLEGRAELSAFFLEDLLSPART